MSTKRKAAASTKKNARNKKKPERVLLWPNEPSTLGIDVIKRAVDKVVDARLAAEKLAASRK